MWGKHGTKIIGTLGTAASILAAADPALVTALLGESTPFVVTGVLSMLTILRGFQNVRVNQAPQDK